MPVAISNTRMPSPIPTSDALLHCASSSILHYRCRGARYTAVQVDCCAVQARGMAMALEVRAEKAPLETDRDGVVRVGQTRVTLDTVVAAYAEGATAEEIVQQYPTLMHGDTYAVIAYYLRRQIEVDDYLRERAMQAAVRRENETRFDRRASVSDCFRG